MTQRLIRGTLKDIVAKAKINKTRPPAIVIIGEVVKLERRFNWLNRTKRILFTGLAKERFFNEGRTYFHLPLIKIKPMESYEEFDGHLRNIKRFDWIVFSSRYGVEYFFKRLNRIGYDSRTLRGISIAAIGSSTSQRLSDFGILADLVPKEESSRGLLEEFGRIDLRDKKIFLPRSDISDKGLSDGFKELGAYVLTGFAYRNVMAEDLPDLDLSFFNEIIFTSPSGVRNFKARYAYVPAGVKIKSIGAVTEKEVKKRLSEKRER